MLLRKRKISNNLNEEILNKETENKKIKFNKKIYNFDKILSKTRLLTNDNLIVNIYSAKLNIEYKISVAIDMFGRDLVLNCSCNNFFGSTSKNKCEHINFFVFSLLNNLSNEEFNIKNYCDLSISKLSSSKLLTIPILSKSSNSEYDCYLNISKDSKIHFFCSCGIKFSKGLRNNCKHIYFVSRCIYNKLSETKEKFDETCLILDKLEGMCI